MSSSFHYLLPLYNSAFYGEYTSVFIWRCSFCGSIWIRFLYFIHLWELWLSTYILSFLSWASSQSTRVFLLFIFLLKRALVKISIQLLLILVWILYRGCMNFKALFFFWNFFGVLLKAFVGSMLHILSTIFMLSTLCIL